MSRYKLSKKHKKNNRKGFIVFNENKEVITTVRSECGIKYSHIQSSESITIVAADTEFTKYRKQEELYIKFIDSIFD